MKCNSLVHWVDRRKKGSGEPIRVPRLSFHVGYEDYQGKPLTQAELEASQKVTLTRCDGDIEVKIQAVDEPDWGGHYAQLNIEYTCNKCHQVHFPHLPTTAETLSEFLTKVISTLPEPIIP